MFLVLKGLSVLSMFCRSKDNVRFPCDPPTQPKEQTKLLMWSRRSALRVRCFLVLHCRWLLLTSSHYLALVSEKICNFFWTKNEQGVHTITYKQILLLCLFKSKKFIPFPLVILLSAAFILEALIQSSWVIYGQFGKSDLILAAPKKMSRRMPKSVVKPSFGREAHRPNKL